MTVAFCVGDAVRWTGGALVGGDEAVALSGVSIDSRTIANDLVTEGVLSRSKRTGLNPLF